MTNIETAQRSALGSIPAVAEDLARVFADAGFSLFLVGGSVRDAVLGRPSHDLDFTTNARPEETRSLLEGWAGETWDMGFSFGTVGASMRGETVEVTTFRSDAYDGVTRNPTVVFGDSIVDDLRRRDFSINAMAVELRSDGHRFVDPFNGLGALEARLLDTPGAPEQAFSDDPLRMLRAVRFVSQLRFSIAPRVLVAMTAMSAELSRITAERVQAEITKMLLGVHPVRAIVWLVETGLADVVLPEVPALRLAIDEHMQHKDVYEHSLVVLEQAIARETDGPDLVLRLAALLHDIGKPATRRKEADGRVSFHRHEVVGAQMARKRLRALRYSNAVVDDVSRLVFLHLRFHGYGDWSDGAVRRYVADAGPLLERLHALVRSDCTTRNARKAAALQRTYDGLEGRVAALREQEELDVIRPDLDGNAIMEILGISPGPLVGQAYQHMLALRMDRGPLSAAEAEAELRAWAKAGSTHV